MVGERRVITMLFCDLKGSTAAAEKVDPEVWTEIMNGAFERMISPIYKYEGTVPRLMGDAILAFFGAPIAHEDDPQRAIYAGLEIQAGLTEYAASMHEARGIEFGARIGINTGLVVVGEIGSDLRMEYTAIGDAINLAARMEQTAPPGTVQITDDTYKLIAPLFDFEAVGEIGVKGKVAAVKAYRVVGRKKVPGQIRGLKELSSPLVGRESELTLLRECWQRLSQGEGSVVAITGEAGLGKSSLIAEIHKFSQINLDAPYIEPQVMWLTGEAQSYSRSVSYFSWRQVIRQSIGATEGDSAADVRGKLKVICDRCGLTLGYIPFLQAILAVETEDSLQTISGFQGEELVARIIEAAREYLCALANQSPLTLVFDDLHWADEASLGLLLNLIDLSKNQPILFLCMLRPDKQAASWETVQNIQKKIPDSFHTILLEPLTAEQIRHLLSNLLGIKELPNRIQDLIERRAQGNPFFIEEIIRSLIDTRQIIQEDGSWQLVSEKNGDPKVSIPDTLRGLLSARIDRLPEPNRHVLQMAAVIGSVFDLRILKQLTKLNDLTLHIEQLREAGMVDTEPPRPSTSLALHDMADVPTEHSFRHVLVQEAAYDSILLKSRRELHLQVAEALERLHPDRIVEFAPLLAHHFYAAQDVRSLKYDLLAGEEAARLYANAEAATHFKRALETAARIDAPLDQVGQLFSKLGGVLELAGRYEQALADYQGMHEFARAHAAPAMELTALMAMATIYSTPTALHNSDLSEKASLQALELSRQIGDLSIQTKLNWNLMLNHLHSRRVDQAYDFGLRALSAARAAEDQEQLAFVLNDLGRVYICRGEFEPAMDVINEARLLWHRLNNRIMLADNLGAEEEALYSLGHYNQLIRVAHEALEICDSIDNPWGKSYHRLLIGLAHFEQGDLQPAIQMAEEAINFGDQGGLIISSIAGRCDLAWFYGSCGAIDKALGIIEPAIKLAAAHLPDWMVMPISIKVRLNLLRDDTRAAIEVAAAVPLEPPSIPYPHYTLMVRQAEIGIAYGRGDYLQALAITEKVLAEMEGIVFGEIPQIMAYKGDALVGLDRMDEALAVFHSARVMAEKNNSRNVLWLIHSGLAAAEARLGRGKQAADHRTAARMIVEEMAEGLVPLGLRESFLSLPRVKLLCQA